MENQEDLAAILMSQATVGDPIRYANLIRATRSDGIKGLRELIPAMKIQLDAYEITAKHANDFRKQVSGDGYARRRKEQKKLFEQIDQSADLMRGGQLDISVILSSHFESVAAIYGSLVQGAELVANARMISLDDSVSKWATSLKDSAGELGGDRVEALFGKVKEGTKDALASLAMEQQINRGASHSFIQGMAILEKIPKLYESYLNNQARNFEMYFERLRQRHSNGMSVASYDGLLKHCNSKNLRKKILYGGNKKVLGFQNTTKVSKQISGREDKNSQDIRQRNSDSLVYIGEN